MLKLLENENTENININTKGLYLSQEQIDILKSYNINYMNFFYTIISTIIYTVIVLKFLLTKFKSEKVLFQS